MPPSSQPSPGRRWCRCRGRCKSTRAGIATLVYTLTIVAMFTVSGTYHRVNWKSPTARKWMKRLDHSMIFVFIAGSYTPFALLALPERAAGSCSGSSGAERWPVWLLKMFWPSAPRWVGVPLYLLLGWVAVGSSARSCTAPESRRWCC